MWTPVMWSSPMWVGAMWVPGTLGTPPVGDNVWVIWLTEV